MSALRAGPSDRGCGVPRTTATLFGAPGSTQTLSRTSPNIVVWSDSGATSPILPQGGANQQASIQFDSTGRKTVYIGWDATTGDNGNTTLTLIPEGSGQAPTSQTQSVIFRKTNTVVVGFAGHTQSPGVAAPNNYIVRGDTGVAQIARTLMNDHYVVRIYPEDPGNQDSLNPDQDGMGAVRAAQDVSSGIENGTISHLAVFRVQPRRRHDLRVRR